MPSVLQIYPSRISITPQRTAPAFGQVEFNKHCPSWIAPENPTWLKNFKIQNNPFVLSKASKRKLFDSVNSMFALSKPRKVQMQNGKTIYNFQLAFITLTLPSTQKHSDIEIKNKCLNQFLIELRKHYNVENFVWKAELQQNENIHFHLIIDKYVDFQAIRRRWNRIVNKLDYVDAYSKKMSKLSLSEYAATRRKTDDINFNDIASAYAKGCQSNWQNPNSVDVRNVSSKKDLAVYLAKYVSKEVSKNEINETTLSRQISFGRSWGRSYSLAQLKYINKFLAEDMKVLIDYLESIPDKVKKISDMFYTVYYFQVSQLAKSFQAFHSKFMFDNARLWNYPIPQQSWQSNI